MKSILTTIIFFTLITLIYPSCKSSTANQSRYSPSANYCCVDTFKLKYQVALNTGKIEKLDQNIYVGILQTPYSVQSIEFKKLVFGDSISSIIALVRQNNESLDYINLHDDDTTKQSSLLYFNKQINYKWKVHIEDSYFWRKEITFLGLSKENNEEIFIYGVEADKNYTSFGNEIAKVYYSKVKGFVKFQFKTHWITVDVQKID